MIIFAHRGASGYAPENTLASFAQAIEQGADGVELDVQLVDGRLIVFHDHRLERATNGAGMIADASIAVLRSLDAGRGQRIPLLTEALDAIDRRAAVNIELKGKNTAAPVAAVIRDAIATKGWSFGDFLVSSFMHPELARFREMMPQVARGVLIMGVPLDTSVLCRNLGASTLNASIEFIDRQLVEDAHSAGAKVLVYTVNHADEIAWLRTIGVDGIFTDFPDRIRAALNET